MIYLAGLYWFKCIKRLTWLMRDASRIVPIIKCCAKDETWSWSKQRWNLEGLISILKRSLVHLLVFRWCHVLIFIILHIADVMFFLFRLIGLGRKPNRCWWSFCSSHFHLVEFCLQQFYFFIFYFYIIFWVIWFIWQLRLRE